MCESGYYLSNFSCLPCPTNCGECTLVNNSLTCNRCKNGSTTTVGFLMSSVNGTCLAQCNTACRSCLTTSTTCYSCINGYFL